MADIFYITRTTEQERKTIQSLLKKYKKQNPRLKIRDIEILIKSMKLFNQIQGE